MKTNIKSIFVCCFAILMLLGFSCKKKVEISTKQNINEVLESNPDYSMYAYAIKKTNLDIFTKGPGPFTFFIPSNTAFSSIGLNSTADLDKLDPLYLAILTAYHFQGTERTFYEIPEGPNASMGTQTGTVQYGTRFVSTDKAYVNGVELQDKGTKAAMVFITK